jgi:hypothetical protein
MLDGHSTGRLGLCFIKHYWKDCL